MRRRCAVAIECDNTALDIKERLLKIVQSVCDAYIVPGQYEEKTFSDGWKEGTYDELAYAIEPDDTLLVDIDNIGEICIAEAHDIICSEIERITGKHLGVVLYRRVCMNGYEGMFSTLQTPVVLLTKTRENIKPEEDEEDSD